MSKRERLERNERERTSRIVRAFSRTGKGERLNQSERLEQNERKENVSTSANVSSETSKGNRLDKEIGSSSGSVLTKMSKRERLKRSGRKREKSESVSESVIESVSVSVSESESFRERERARKHKQCLFRKVVSALDVIHTLAQTFFFTVLCWGRLE
jgi:hypothetical protein